MNDQDPRTVTVTLAYTDWMALLAGLERALDEYRRLGPTDQAFLGWARKVDQIERVQHELIAGLGRSLAEGASS